MIPMTIPVALFLVSCTIFTAITPCDSPCVKNEKSFLVAGYSIRTSNAGELSERGRIGELWRRFQQQKLSASIPNRIDQNVVVVYSNYITDERGEFNYMLGARVSSVRNLPPNSAQVEIHIALKHPH
jgi:predicted transcriptional regulator YdeE